MTALDIFDEITRSYPQLNNKQCIDLTKLVVYDNISKSWLDLIVEQLPKSGG